MYVPEPNGSDFTPPPPGTHVALCYRFIDLGTQMIEWKGAKKTQRKVLLSWELPNELIPDGELAGKPFTIGKRYTWSMSDKATLRHDLEAWRGRSFTDADFRGPNRFNIKNILGKPCMLTIVHEEREGRTYANIKGVTAMPKGMVVETPTPVNPLTYFALDKEFFDNTVLDSLSDKLKETIKGSPEYRELIDASYRAPTSENEYGANPDDEIPF